eukprot:2304828-Prymnesium_polylepis.1
MEENRIFFGWPIGFCAARPTAARQRPRTRAATLFAVLVGGRRVCAPGRSGGGQDARVAPRLRKSSDNRAHPARRRPTAAATAPSASSPASRQRPARGGEA